MVKTIPRITIQQMEYMKSRKEREIVRVGKVNVDIQPYMFPPKSPFSYSTRILLDNLNALDLSGQKVLEIGTGCGIVSIVAAKQGALVDGVDILPECIEFSFNNAMKNRVSGRTKFYYSNMFSDIRGGYDYIICNLPILEGDLPEEDSRWYSLFDPRFEFHKTLFMNGKKFAPKIMMAHANLRGNRSFEKLESLARKYGWSPKICAEEEYSGYKWRAYMFEIIK